MTDKFPPGVSTAVEGILKCPTCKGMGGVWTEWRLERCEECNGVGRIKKDEK